MNNHVVSYPLTHPYPPLDPMVWIRKIWIYHFYRNNRGTFLYFNCLCLPLNWKKETPPFNYTNFTRNANVTDWTIYQNGTTLIFIWILYLFMDISKLQFAFFMDLPIFTLPFTRSDLKTPSRSKGKLFCLYRIKLFRNRHIWL